MAQIRAIITDLDGCLTDGGMYYTSLGEPSTDFYSNPYYMMGLFAKRFHTRDAAAARWLHENTDVMLFVITAGDHPRNNAINEVRMKVMYLTEPISQCVEDKHVKVNGIAQEYELELDEIVYIGDDRADLLVLGAVGVSCCPRDALSSVRGACSLISYYDGGQGVLADVVDRLHHNGRIKEKRE